MIAAIRLCDVCLTPLDAHDGYTGELVEQVYGKQIDLCDVHGKQLLEKLTKEKTDDRTQ